MSKYQSWGNYPAAQHHVYHLHSVTADFPELTQDTLLLAYGQGRSYGDVCQNNDGILLDTRYLDHFIAFDQEQGLLRCESGVTLATILQTIVPRGWFLPVTPGTKFVSVGGAIANDVHGKNHHRAGTFGCHLVSFELLRSDGQRLVCSADQNSELFAATIGGLGLTGLITWAEFKLKKIPGALIEQQTLRFNNLEEFFQISADSSQDWEYTVAWVDCLASGKQLGRGLFMRGNHVTGFAKVSDKTTLTMPFNAPGFLLNKYTVQAFNQLYYHRPVKQQSTIPYDPFFYPLDKIAHWNRLYGKRGFMQYQCVIPPQHAHDAMHEILQTIAASGQGSFLSVLKEFGDIASPGLLSFPRPGVTLALDFSNKGESTLQLLEQLDKITREAHGAVYPAKDARMSSESFTHYFPHWQQFSQYIDPHFRSDFWKRVTGVTLP